MPVVFDACCVDTETACLVQVVIVAPYCDVTAYLVQVVIVASQCDAVLVATADVRCVVVGGVVACMLDVGRHLPTMEGHLMVQPLLLVWQGCTLWEGCSVRVSGRHVA